MTATSLALRARDILIRHLKITSEHARRILEISWLPVTTVTACGLFLRFLLATSNQVDIDEALAYAPAASSYLSGNWTMNIEHPMFIKFIFAGSMILFGTTGRLGTLFPWLPDSIGAIRFSSCLMGGATVLVIYSLIRLVTGSRFVGLIAAVQLAFNPIAIGESSYGLLDPGMTFLYMSSILFFYKYAKTGARKNFWISSVIFGLAVASKYFAFIALFIGIALLSKKRALKKHIKLGALYLMLAALIFFAIQPYFWGNTLSALWESFNLNWIHLSTDHLVKQPGNPFLIPESSFYGTPWPNIGTSPFASKPEFASSLADLIQPPWWYNLYIMAMYSTPFEMIIFALASYQIVRGLLNHRLNDLAVLGASSSLVPIVYFAIQPLRLPQYNILLSTSASTLSPLVYVSLKGRSRTLFLAALGLLHVGWTTIFLLTPAGTFSGWGYYITPLTPIIANFFHWLLEFG